MINKYLLGIALFVSATCYAGNCDYYWQSDSIGRNCGERSRYTDYIYQQQRGLEQQQRELERYQRELERQQREQLQREIERQREAERQQREWEWERQQRLQQRQWENQQNGYSYPSPYLHY